MQANLGQGFRSLLLALDEPPGWDLLLWVLHLSPCHPWRETGAFSSSYPETAAGKEESPSHLLYTSPRAPSFMLGLLTTGIFPSNQGKAAQTSVLGRGKQGRV